MVKQSHFNLYLDIIVIYLFWFVFLFIYLCSSWGRVGVIFNVFLVLEPQIEAKLHGDLEFEVRLVPNPLKTMKMKVQDRKT